MVQDLDKMTPKFSVVLIARNEEKTLPKLIASLNEFQSRGGEVILVDTGSKDRTVEIAKELGCKTTEVGERFIKIIDKDLAKKINEKFVVDGENQVVEANSKIFDYSAARNFAAELSSNDFVAMPDCDEQYTKLNIDEINKKIEEGAEQFEYNFVYSHDANGKEAIKFTHSKFYNRKVLKWVGIIHEVLNGNAKRHFFDESFIKLEHWQVPSENRSRYLAGLALDCFLHPEKDRNSHYFAREMFYNKMWKSASKEFERHISMNKWQTERGQSMLYLGDCLINLGKIEDGLQQYHRATITGPTRRAGFIRLAAFMSKNKDFIRSICYAKAALEIPYLACYTESMHQYSHEPHYYLYYSYGWAGNKIKEARFHNNAAIDLDLQNERYLRDWSYYNYNPKVSIVIPTLGREESLSKLLEAIEKNANYNNYEIIVQKDSFEDRKGVCKMFNEGVKKSTGDYVMFLGNDCLPQKNFLVHAVRQMSKSFENFDGMIALKTIFKTKDGYRQFIGENSSHFLISKKLLCYFGNNFFNPIYNHYFCDNELAERCIAMNKFSLCEHSIVLHNNPHHAFEVEHDEVSRISYSFFKQDEATFTKRMKQLGFYKNLVEKYPNCLKAL
jgi:glycosyltransferase involved in cell wall biosynthesis